MARDESVDVEQRRNGRSTGDPANLNPDGRGDLPVDRSQPRFSHDVYGVAEAGEDRYASTERTARRTFADQLHSEPHPSEGISLRESLRHGTGTGLRHDADEIGKSKRDTHEPPDLSDVVGMSLDEDKAGAG